MAVNRAPECERQICGSLFLRVAAYEGSLQDKGAERTAGTVHLRGVVVLETMQLIKLKIFFNHLIKNFNFSFLHHKFQELIDVISLLNRNIHWYGWDNDVLFLFLNLKI